MGKKIQLSEAALAKIIKESVMAEIDRRKVMPSKYYDIFKNRIVNAQHVNFGDVKKTVMEFYRDFKSRVPNEGFTLENLMDLADNIDGGGTTHEKSDMPGGHKIKDAGSWWGMNAGKFLEEKKVKITEGQLRKLIKESVMKAIMNEISTDMMRNARDKFGDTYGPKWVDDTSNPMGPKDHQFYPKKMQYKPTKDGKDFSIHMKNFNDAIVKSEAEEIKNLSDEELANRAEEIWNKYSKDADFEEYDRDGGEVWGNVTLEVDGWEFSTDASGFGHRDYNLDWDVVGDSVDFTAPDGRSGSFSI